MDYLFNLLTLVFSYTSLALFIAALSANLSTSPCNCLTLSCHPLFFSISSFKTWVKTAQGDRGVIGSSLVDFFFCDCCSDFFDSSKRRAVDEMGRSDWGGRNRRAGSCCCRSRRARRKTGRECILCFFFYTKM